VRDAISTFVVGNSIDDGVQGTPSFSSSKGKRHSSTLLGVVNIFLSKAHVWNGFALKERKQGLFVERYDR
jgi:hypothetical protein